MNDARALYVAVPALGMSMLLLEVLAFRISASVLDADFAAFVAFWLPAAAGVGAAVLPRARETAAAVLARRASHLAALAGAATLAGAVGFSWVSERIARAPDEANALHGAIALAAWLAPAFFAGGALALAVRLGWRQLGRVGWSEAVGAAATCLSLGVLLEMGAPRVVLGTALPFAVAALALAYVGRSARPSWGALATLPLAALVLLIGDIAAPWLKTDGGPHANLQERLWTAQGVLAVRNGKSGKPFVTIDKSYELFLAENHRGTGPARFAVQDLVYLANESAQGPSLVIGSAGGREVALALARGHAPVDAIAQHGVLVNERFGEHYAELTEYLVADDRLTLTVGDGRGRLSELPEAHYQRITVLGESRPVQIGPRLLPRHDRSFTLDAVRDYLARLRPGGTLLLQVPRTALASLLATLRAALGENADAQLMACTTRLDWTGVVVHTKSLSKEEQTKLMERCRRSMEVEFPSSAEFAAGTVARDQRPFLDSGDADAMSAFGALIPGKKQASRGQADVATAASLALLPAVVVVALWRSRSRSVPRAFELSIAPFGIALALCVFALLDAFIESLGNPAYAWPLLIPMTLVGIGAGRLWIDVVNSPRYLRAALLAACGWLILMALVAPPLLGAASRGLALALSLPLLSITAAALGAPLYVIMRTLREHGIERAIATHQLGWALGGSLAVMIAYQAGLRWVLVVGVAFFAGALVLSWPALRASER